VGSLFLSTGILAHTKRLNEHGNVFRIDWERPVFVLPTQSEWILSEASSSGSHDACLVCCSQQKSDRQRSVEAVCLLIDRMLLGSYRLKFHTLPSQRHCGVSGLPAGNDGFLRVAARPRGRSSPLRHVRSEKTLERYSSQHCPVYAAERLSYRVLDGVCAALT